jgi:3-oxoacyl-[acyl-carrier-protein] synthase-3
VPKGACKTNTLAEDVSLRSKDLAFLHMDGGEVFNFTLRTVPKLLTRTLEFAGYDSCDYDAFLFHQANLFMLMHLIKKLKLPHDCTPINIDCYGNTSCASIPLLITTNLAERLRKESLLISMVGFGVGYSWASASMRVGPLKIVELIEI